MKSDKLIELIDIYLKQGHISLLDVEYGNIPLNPAFIMRESRSKILQLEKELKKINDEYTILSEQYRDLEWKITRLEK